MLRQALFTNARAVRSAIPAASRTAFALGAQAQQAARPAVFASLPVRTARWYSSENGKDGAEKKDGEAAKAEEGKKEEVEDPLKKKLEAKEKEVVDLKVCIFPSLSGLLHGEDRDHYFSVALRCSPP